MKTEGGSGTVPLSLICIYGPGCMLLASHYASEWKYSNGELWLKSTEGERRYFNLPFSVRAGVKFGER